MQLGSLKMRSYGDLWGGLASMLVALPAAVAFGVTVYAAIGPQYAAFGALAGIAGAVVLGLVAPSLGGTDRLVSAPCAPAAAVLSAFAIELVGQGVDATTIVLMLTVLGILAGGMQILIGFIGLGRLIKYIPFPVVSGYLSAVGLIIVGGQVGNLVGAPAGSHWWQALLDPAGWDLRTLIIGGATAGVALLAPRLTTRVPATILGIAAGGVAYFALSLDDATMRVLDGNRLVLGQMSAQGQDYFGQIAGRWQEIGNLRLSQVAALFGNALTLAALLSIDTLKTCVALDQMTRTRHEPNRELVAQGIANIAASSIGGMPGAGTMGPTLVNMTSGAQTRLSGVMEGVFAALAALLLGSFIAWVPGASLAGILLVIGVRMIDFKALRFLESRATAFDFAVVLTVIIVALTVGLIAASASGVLVSIVLFLREQVGGNVVRRKTFVGQRSSTWYRPEAQMRVLEQHGDQAIIFELQGSLFFGTAAQLYAAMEPEVKRRRYVILDLGRVQSVDVTAAHVLNQLLDTLIQRKAPLLLANVSEQLPNGINLRELLEHAGVITGDDNVRVFPTLEGAIEWAEDQIVGDDNCDEINPVPLRLQEMELFAGRKDETLADLEQRMTVQVYKAGEPIYALGERGDAIYLIRRGAVKIFAPVGGSRRLHHIATFGRGDFFGGLAFLDGRPRSNDAVAEHETELYVLSQEQFAQLSEEHKRLAFILISAVARALAQRLRHTDQELALLHE